MIQQDIQNLLTKPRTFGSLSRALPESRRAVRSTVRAMIRAGLIHQNGVFLEATRKTTPIATLLKIGRVEPLDAIRIVRPPKPPPAPEPYRIYIARTSPGPKLYTLENTEQVAEEIRQYLDQHPNDVYQTVELGAILGHPSEVIRRAADLLGNQVHISPPRSQRKPGERLLISKSTGGRSFTPEMRRVLKLLRDNYPDYVTAGRISVKTGMHYEPTHAALMDLAQKGFVDLYSTPGVKGTARAARAVKPHNSYVDPLDFSACGADVFQGRGS